MSRIHLRISGRVHGVWFRASTRDRAVSLGLAGWVRNIADGSVEVLAEGEEEPLRLFVEWCREGPPAARVDEVTVERSSATGELSGFRVR